MNDQLSLLPERSSRPRAPYQKGSPTSKAAAERIAPKSHQQREIVFQAIQSRGEFGATRKELEQITGFLTQAICPRLVELEGDPSKDLPRRIRKLFRLVDGESVLVKRDGCGVLVVITR